MKKLQKEDKATKQAVDDAKTNLTIAVLNYELALLKQAAAAEKAAKSAATLGFYADVQLIRSGDKTNIISDSSQEIASNLIAGNDVNINSGSSLTSSNTSSEIGNSNIKGNIESINQDINITSFNDTNIEAIKNDSSSSTKTEGFTQSISLGASYGNSSTQKLINSITAQLSKRNSKSDNSNRNYTNTNIVANSGTININSTNNDTNINGANITADNIIINSGNDLNVASLQNTSNSSSKSKSIGAGGGKSSASLNYSSSKSEFSKNWVDDQTDIIANNNITINTANNTDLKGALINSKTDNLTINTGTLTYSDIIDTEIQESSSFGISTNISVGQHSNNPDASNPNQDKNYYPDGSTTLSMANNGYEKEQITRATIGSGIINITNNNNNQTQDITSLNRDINKNQEITKDTITGALNIQTTIDNRIIGAIIGNEGAQDSLVKTITNAPGNTFETAKQLSDLTGMIPGSPVWVSRYINDNNNEFAAPNIIPGLFLKTSEMGQDPEYDLDGKITNYSVSNRNPVFQFLNHTIPGGYSATSYHDVGMMKNQAKSLEKIYTIPHYFLFNYYGSVGTLVDVRNYEKNYLNIKNDIFTNNQN